MAEKQTGLSLNEKLDLWVQITGVNPSEERSRWSISMNSDYLSDWDIKRMNDRILAFLSQDETGVFADACLQICFSEFLKKKSVSLFELVQNPELSEYAALCRKLWNSLLESSSGDLLLANAKKAMAFYDLSTDGLSASDILDLSFSAKYCMSEKGLNLVQFAAGDFSDESFRFLRDVYAYRDVRDVIHFAALGHLDGVSLCYVRDAEEITSSYFGFVIKNGGNLYLLSDRPVAVHPMAKGMSRCPGRNMSTRTESNHFPYSLTGIDMSDLWDSGRYGVSESGTGLSASLDENRRFKIGSLGSMKPDEAFWVIYMLDLIQERFFKGHVTLPELSFTGSSVDTPLLSSGKQELAVLSNMERIFLPQVGNLDDRTYYDREVYGTFSYLVNRYGSHVDLSVLDAVHDVPKLPSSYDPFCKSEPLASLDLSGAVYTEEKLRYDQMWVARYNMAVSVMKLVEADYERRKHDLYGWVRTRLVNRVHDLVLSHLKGEFVRTYAQRKTFSNETVPKTASYSKQVSFPVFIHEHYSKHTHFVITPGYRWTKDADLRCIFTGKPVQAVIKVFPKTVDDLAFVCGCPVSELPVELQHFGVEGRYAGNPILQDVDPYDFKLSDPFAKMDFSFSIFINGKVFLQLQKEAGVPQDAFWRRSEPGCYDPQETKDAVRCESVKYKDGHVIKKCGDCPYRRREKRADSECEQ